MTNSLSNTKEREPTRRRKMFKFNKEMQNQDNSKPLTTQPSKPTQRSKQSKSSSRTDSLPSNKKSKTLEVPKDSRSTSMLTKPSSDKSQRD